MMLVSRQFTAFVQKQLSTALNRDTQLQHVSRVSGGSINAAYCLHTGQGEYMMKVNDQNAYPNMFKHEREGLDAIRKTRTVAVPQIVLLDNFEGQSFLILEWIEHRRATPQASQLLGQQLAALHCCTAPQFGFSANNYMGSLPQSNRQHATWAGFYITERLQPMVKLGADKHLLTQQDVQDFEKLYLNLGGLFDEEPPAFIHGDLWGGNYLVSTDHKPYLIDPAVSYGHREFDLAMTTLFGGFGREFYESYQEAFPLAKGWHTRIDLWNLYPLLIHLNLFGVGYLGQVRDNLQAYI